MALAYETELESALEEEFNELGEGELPYGAEGEGILGALSGLGSLASGLGKLGGVVSGIGKLGSGIGKIGSLAGGIGKIGGLAGGLGKLGGAAGALGKLGGVAKLGGIARLGGVARGVGRLGGGAGRIARIGGGAAGRIGRSANLARLAGAKQLRGLTRGLSAPALLRKSGLGKYATVGRNFARTRSVKGLARDLDKLGVIAKAGTLGKYSSLIRNFGKTRSLPGLIRNLDKLGIAGRAGTLGKFLNLGRNFAKTRSIGGLVRDFDKIGILGKAGTIGKLATLGRDFAKTRSLGGLVRGVDRLGVLGKSGSLGKLAALAGNLGQSRTIGQFIANASPLLRQTARVAAPMVGTAIGGAPGILAVRMLSRLLREGEAEISELENELELEFEGEAPETLHETELEIWNHELAFHEAAAEIMAEAAQYEQNEVEAETMAGAAALTVISPDDRRELQEILPHLLHGTAILTRILRASPTTRPAVRAVPTITRRTVLAIKKRATAGVPITRSLAGETAAREIRRVLASPVACATAVANNLRATRLLRAA